MVTTSSSMGPSELSLVSASIAGDVRAYRQLVEKYQSLVCAVALGATGDRALAEELAQEAFVTAWNKLPELRDLDRFKPWVCGIVRNHARAARRHLRRHAPDAVHRAEPADVHCVAPSPLDRVISLQEERLVSGALAQLGERYREPLFLFYAERLPIREIAELLGLSDETVRQRLARGRRMLRADIEALSVTRRGSAGIVAGVLAAIAIPGAARASAPAAHGPVAAISAGLAAVAIAMVIAIAAIGGAPAAEASDRVAPESLAIADDPVVTPARAHDPPQPAAVQSTTVAVEGVVEIGRGSVARDGSSEAIVAPRRRAHPHGSRRDRGQVDAGARRTRVIHGPATIERRPLLRPSVTLDDVL